MKDQRQEGIGLTESFIQTQGGELTYFVNLTD